MVFYSVRQRCWRDHGDAWCMRWPAGAASACSAFGISAAALLVWVIECEQDARCGRRAH